jgi:hypothetical protein
MSKRPDDTAWFGIGRNDVDEVYKPEPFSLALVAKDYDQRLLGMF